MSPMNEQRRQTTADDLERTAVLRAKAREARGESPQSIQAKLQAAAALAKALREGQEYPGLVVEIVTAITHGQHLTMEGETS